MSHGMHILIDLLESLLNCVIDFASGLEQLIAIFSIIEEK